MSPHHEITPTWFVTLTDPIGHIEHANNHAQVIHHLQFIGDVVRSHWLKELKRWHSRNHAENISRRVVYHDGVSLCWDCPRELN